jgi:hypothetical protein
MDWPAWVVFWSDCGHEDGVRWAQWWRSAVARLEYRHTIDESGGEIKRSTYKLEAAAILHISYLDDESGDEIRSKPLHIIILSDSMEEKQVSRLEEKQVSRLEEKQVSTLEKRHIN